MTKLDSGKGLVLVLVRTAVTLRKERPWRPSIDSQPSRHWVGSAVSRPKRRPARRSDFKVDSSRRTTFKRQNATSRPVCRGPLAAPTLGSGSVFRTSLSQAGCSPPRSTSERGPFATGELAGRDSREQHAPHATAASHSDAIQP